jgi:hypothetical protein
MLKDEILIKSMVIQSRRYGQRPALHTISREELEDSSLVWSHNTGWEALVHIIGGSVI